MLSDKISILRDRAHMLAKSRQFFKDYNVVEVDCPFLSRFASVDTNIELIPAQPIGGARFLHTSPEYCMKRLLAAGMGDIFQLSHVFRNGEQGVKHNPEFTMAEWYRAGITFERMIDETIEYIRLFLGDLPYQTMSYRDVIKKYAGFDYLHLSIPQLIDKLKSFGIDVYPGIEKEGKDAVLNLVMGTIVEPNLGKDELFVLSHFPASQAALAKICQRGDESVGERFEVYYKGFELSNGYHELSDPKEQRKRLLESNQERVANNRSELPIDEFFLKALEKGFPDTCGVAVGFDRLMMLRHNAQHIADVLPFSWDEV